ncbi:1-deoxy-D-xylulose-5-phosphate reductoisomerase [Acetobacterium wieringae]|uniref:1-deoxy-D-xylulose 5-phosphate reductoisomerase n=1 Tax=Acetobacterium wieringae TaxID=52694 RepID=A0ABY6HJQ7_9FIRM|nr:MULTISPECIES: 1-deoxy-D-xylulose-5-phosphate reductoisomerase [Acetobacterium]OXS25135.1 MAG: 1-deoxy-D-xylulose-5-phosphate reductoisomerase [Acetobacterium sp. MES1]UYO63778.1 1-deoxy-D-xylulose-5-phosphate reductoisomerase [Acetobacterium wieringae]VUZ27343.1 1-deoxy-D-xylulose 5-phosphate reductoisomerase [Acetobacterium wieringae]
MKNISILGSTGSIGTQALEVVSENSNALNIVGLTTNTSIDLLEKQIDTYSPRIVCVMDGDTALVLEKRLKKRGLAVDVVTGLEGLIAVATASENDLLLTAVSGMIGLQPTLAAINAGIDIALANKETLVAGGQLVMDAAAASGVSLLPVDSEHCAIFQCLMGNKHEEIDRIIITASGGPFRGYSHKQLESVTLAQALKHPNWSMGKKITIDSATLMNKGLEVIEAKWLFNLRNNQIDVVVHPQSIVHSMVEFIDHSTIAQLGLPDMALPIQIAFFYPERVANNRPALDFSQIRELTFSEPDRIAFPCLQLAYDALEIGGTMACVLNAANEIAVSRFLNQEISFLDIPRINRQVMEQHQVIVHPNLDDVLAADAWAREISNAYN